MGEIKGVHSSPGVYTRLSQIARTTNNVSLNTTINNTSKNSISNGGGSNGGSNNGGVKYSAGTNISIEDNVISVVGLEDTYPPLNTDNFVIDGVKMTMVAHPFRFENGEKNLIIMQVLIILLLLVSNVK